MNGKSISKKWFFGLAILLLVVTANVLPGQFGGLSGRAFAATDPSEYYNRFMELFTNLQNSGYLSQEGVPYHCVETLMVEAPDYGHLTTSEAFSYLTWLGATYGKLTGDWSYYKTAWDKAETYIIPTTSDQLGLSTYNPSSPASYAPELDLPSDYPNTGNSSAPTGTDPLDSQLKAAYGSNRFYQMHWLMDVDNWYGYGNHGDGTSRCSYINTYQRGPQESVWETVPHPSWESFNWGAGSNGGFLPIFGTFGTPSKQWRYTSASDADARQIQASYWAYLWAKEQGKESTLSTYTAKAAKMGDYLRYTMFDKYFRPIGVQAASTAGTGYDSCHYMLSWYTSWGGSTDGSWSWRIGCSHIHQGYQNPVAAYVLSTDAAFTPLSSYGKRDWTTSLQRQIELYQYLQSNEGAIAGGVTNSYNGRYMAYPSGSSTFYKMVYDWQPVYHDPPSNRWFGMQAWGMERMMEYYYLTGDSKVKNLVDKWANWAISNTIVDDNDDSYMIPSDLTWSGQPDTWTGTATNNTNLHCTVSSYTNDVGVAAGLAKALIYYAAAYQKYTGSVHTTAKETAAKLLDRMWNLYRDTIGVACDETRSDYSRFFDEVYIPTSYSGTNAQGATLKNGMTFIDMRPRYKNDPSYQKVVDAHNNGTAPVFKYHRFWAQADIAMANALYYVYLAGTANATATPTFSPAAGSYSTAQSVTIGCATSGATIRYTTDGSTPTSSSMVYSGPISVSKTTTIKAYATASGMTDSAVATAAYTIGATQQVATPTFSPTGGVYNTAQSVTISCATSGATIRYTTDGSTPTSSSAIYSGPIAVSKTTTMKAYATASGMTDSAVATATYTISASSSYAVTYSIANDWGNGATVNVTITNNSTAALSGWTLAWTFPGNQKISNMWNGSYTQNGTAISVTNLNYNGTIGANGGTASFGFNLTYSGSNAKPSSFTLNGTACQVQ